MVVSLRRPDPANGVALEIDHRSGLVTYDPSVVFRLNCNDQLRTPGCNRLRIEYSPFHADLDAGVCAMQTTVPATPFMTLDHRNPG
jgi:hypothetical protein